MNEKFNKNAKVEKLTKKVGRCVRLIVIGPLIWSEFKRQEQLKMKHEFGKRKLVANKFLK